MKLSPEHKRTLREVFIAWAAVILANSLLYRANAAGLISDDWLFILSAVLLVYVPIVILFRKKERMDFMDRSTADFLKSAGLMILTSLVIFPLALAGNHLYQSWAGRAYLPQGGIPWGVIAFNRLLMALPEEFFFRGYFQVKLDTVFGRPFKFLGAPVGASLFIVSALFALSHSLIHAQWWHAFIFFPSLVFGWLQAKRGTIVAPTLFHALCNIFSDWANFNYR